jgi:endonuclease YncB( thermonuclease family)
MIDQAELTRSMSLFLGTANSRIVTRLLLTSVAVLFLTYPALPDFSGPVASVLDGDTIEVLHNNRAERIRLSGIDCPEKGQAYGNNAKQAASELVFGKEVTLKTHGQDKYRRTLADVLLPDGTNVNHMLVNQGWCWWYRKYAPGDTVLEGLETEAREAKKGLWTDPHPVPPWEWRHRRHEAL